MIYFRVIYFKCFKRYQGNDNLTVDNMCKNSLRSSLARFSSENPFFDMYISLTNLVKIKDIKKLYAV